MSSGAAVKPVLIQCMLAALVSLSALAATTKSEVSARVPRIAAAVPAALLVEPDDGVRPLARLINRAQDRIFVEAYILSDARIKHALERASAQGVTVYIILEHHPFGLGGLPERSMSELRAAGAHIRWSSPRFRYTHAKMMVLDDRAAVISTANFSRAGFTSDRDAVVVDTAAADVRAASEIFRADWNHLDPVVSDRTLVVAPRSARRQLAQLCAQARRTLDVYSEELTDPAMEGLLLSLARHGVRVRVLLPAGTSLGPLKRLRSAVSIRTLASPYVHAKVIVADGSLAFVGSENLSETSLDRNREIGLMVRGRAVQRLTNVFARDWGLAVGKEPVALRQRRHIPSR